MPINRNQGFLLLAAVVLCQCQGATKAESPVMLQVDTGISDPSPVPQQSDPTHREDTLYISLDFGSIAIGQRGLQSAGFRNIGAEDLTIVRVDHSSGATEFSVDLPSPLTIVAGGPTVSLTVHFVPLATTGPKVGQIVLKTDSESRPFIELDVMGMALRFALLLAPQTLEFGNVVAGTRAIQSLTVTNRSGIDARATVGPMLGTSPLLFTAEPAVGAIFQLSDRETTSMAVAFWPVAPSTSQSQAYFSLDLCGNGTGCHEVVSARGWAVATGLAVTPDYLDLGSVPPDATLTAEVTLSSVANLTIHLTADPSVLNDNPDGTKTPLGPWQLGAGAPMKGIAIPPGQSVQIPVIFTAPATGTATGELDLATDDPSNSSIVVQLKG